MTSGTDESGRRLSTAGSILAAEFTADEMALIDKACGVWTYEKFAHEAVLDTARYLLATSTEEQRRGGYPVLPFGCPCIGTPDEEDCPHD